MGSDILPAVWDLTVVVRGQMLRSAWQGQEAHSRQGLTDSSMWSVSRPAKLLNHEGQTCGVWDMVGHTYSITYTYCSCMHTRTVAYSRTTSLSDHTHFPLMWAIHFSSEQIAITDKTLWHFTSQKTAEELSNQISSSPLLHYTPCAAISWPRYRGKWGGMALLLKN